MLNKEEIEKIIPHRAPFLLLDEITYLEPGKKAEGIKNVTAKEYWIPGHFPTNPVMPGVLMIEALAQVGAVCILSMDEYKGKTAYFGGIKKARFKKIVKPGDLLKLEVELNNIRLGTGFGIAVATVDGEVAVEAELTFAVRE